MDEQSDEQHGDDDTVMLDAPVIEQQLAFNAQQAPASHAPEPRGDHAQLPQFSADALALLGRITTSLSSYSTLLCQVRDQRPEPLLLLMRDDVRFIAVCACSLFCLQKPDSTWCHVHCVEKDFKE